jgi:hypothetical protein
LAVFDRLRIAYGRSRYTQIQESSRSDNFRHRHTRKAAMTRRLGPGPAPWSSREQQLSPLIEIAERSLTVLQLAELNLQWASPSWSASYAHEWLETNEFDAAPVENEDPYLFIERGKTAGDSVIKCARSIDSSRLVSADLGLADGILRLKKYSYYFILKGDKLHGIVTRSDLQRPAVNMVLFSLILAAESAANVIILKYLGDSWADHLSERGRKGVEKTFNSREEMETQISRLDCLGLPDRLDLLGKCPQVLSYLGFDSAASLEEWKKRVRPVRNSLAHGRTLLHAEKDPVLAIDLFENIRSFARNLWDLTKDDQAL